MSGLQHAALAAMPDQHYAIGVGLPGPCTPDLHAWATTTPAPGERCWCMSKAWPGFSPADLQALQSAMSPAPFSVADLAAVVRRYPRTILRLAREPRRD